MILEEIIRKQKQEIEILKKNNVKALKMASSNMIKMQSLKVEKKELQERIDKAIEYIKDYGIYQDGHCKCGFTKNTLDSLLNILKGENKE